jgi:CBS domain-containing protein
LFLRGTVPSGHCSRLRRARGEPGAARKTRDLDCGFLPVADPREEKLSGVITDRDITLRAVADGRDPAKTTVGDIQSDRVLYCFRNDDVTDAARSMQKQQVYRLVVLANVLPPEAFNKQHIRTSINVPHEDPDFTAVMEKVAGGKSRKIVVYCASFDCDASEKGARPRYVTRTSSRRSSGRSCSRPS